jgi:hypothetical protein
MAQPEYVPLPPTDRPRTYESPNHVPRAWIPGRPSEIEGRQPVAERLGWQGPDQGYGLRLANRFHDRLHLAEGESVDDVVTGALVIGLRRASMFGRAPMIHDFTIAYTIWGFLDPQPPAQLVELREQLFVGVATAVHHTQRRRLADCIPEATLRRSHQDVKSAYPQHWRDLVGA